MTTARPRRLLIGSWRSRHKDSFSLSRMRTTPSLSTSAGLQELMAGRALVMGDDASIRRNLIASACSPAWRNAWLFAAGRLFADSDHRARLVVAIVEHCDSDDLWPGWLYPAAPELAAHMLDDGLAANRPIAQKQLVEVALRCLAGPHAGGDSSYRFRSQSSGRSQPQASRHYPKRAGEGPAQGQSTGRWR